MNLFKELNERGHEQVSFFHDPNSGLKGIVAIHNSNKENISTNEASDREAEDRIRKIGELKTFYLPEKKTFKIRNA